MSFRVATWNVEYAAGTERNARRLELIHRAGADIVVLTETHDDLGLSGYEATSTTQRPSARAGARWTTIWSRLAVRRRIETADPVRTVAVELEGDLIVFGTVLPWHSDRGPAEDKQLSWSEYRRVVPIQGAEWRALRQGHPGQTLIVAGDFNQSLGDRHYYGGRALRQLLEAECASADLDVLTGLAHQQAPLAWPAIDHIAVAPRSGRWARARDLAGWEGAWEGPGRLSDHSAVAVAVELLASRPDAESSQQ
jgi:endonuclease/exonuclease/phosphatase family metal-dependent hydrolase